MKIINMESALRERRNQLIKAGTFEEKVPVVYGEYRSDNPAYVTKRFVNGEMECLDPIRPVGEMITTAAGRQELLQKAVLNVELGRERIPLLYQPIYEVQEDKNFPEVFDAPWAQHGVVIFLEHAEGEEVRFGHIQAEKGPTARIVTYAAGFEYTEKMVKFNQTFGMTELERAFGEAYNALLNHMHLGPFMIPTYAAANKTAAVYVDAEGTPLKNATGAHPALSLRETIKKALADARKAKRPGSILLVAGENEIPVQEALSRLWVRGTDYQAIGGIDAMIAYDGWKVTVGKKDFSYGGVPANKAYLIRPKRGFKELIKEDLIIDAGDGDISRLVESQLVGRAYRGTYCAMTENVQEITLPSFS